jgi:hypothetical protein
MHNGYKCLEVSTGRVYISHDVIFDEDVFPFSTLHPNVGPRLCDELNLLHPTLFPHSFVEITVPNHIIANPCTELIGTNYGENRN